MLGFSRSGHVYDAVIVGARGGGAALAVHLACAGWRVALLDPGTDSTDAPATHVLFPDALRELDNLGVLDRLAAVHDLAVVRLGFRVWEGGVARELAPLAGRSQSLSVRRSTLDGALVETARQCSAQVMSNARVVAVTGAGDECDPVSGVVLSDGRRLRSRWVIGADGGRSIVARLLNVPPGNVRAGNTEILYGYWRGVPDREWCRLEFQTNAAIVSAPLEDGFHLLWVAGTAGVTGGHPQIERRYDALLRRFPATLDPGALSGARRASSVFTMPESRMRGHQRVPSGHGWALTGDACLMAHPILGHGFVDALHQSRYVAEDLLAGGSLAGYASWCADKAAGRYERSFRAATFPTQQADLLADLAYDSIPSDQEPIGVMAVGDPVQRAPQGSVAS